MTLCLAPARLLAGACLLAATAPALAAPADVFRQWQSDAGFTRRTTFAELGLRQPIVLDGANLSAQRDIFLPVPAGIALQAASVQIDASYLRADGGRSTLVWSLDGTPAAARGLAEQRGDASQQLAIDGAARRNGFVRLGAAWHSVISDVVCADQRAPGNVLRIEPTSRFSYRLDRRAITSLATAWGALPPEPVLLVPRNASAAAYDTAWRIGVALERGGKRVQVLGLPGTGDVVPLAGLAVPADLRGVPAFAALAAAGGSHTVANAAEAGALLALGAAGGLRADIAVADPALAGQLAQALDALAAQLPGEDARAAFQQWRASAFAGLEMPGEQAVRLGSIGGVPTILVAADAGSRAAALFGEMWRPVAQGAQIAVQAAAAPRADQRILLSQLGGLAGSLDVLQRAEWSAGFGIGDVLDDGRRPTAVVLDLSAAPDAQGEPPVVTVYLNDFLLGARVLHSDGKPQRVRIDVPEYTLAARNTLRLAFLRQPTKPRCHDVQTGYPVSVLPSSHLELGRFAPGDNFFGMHRRFAGGAELLVPKAWLADAPATLPRVIRIADAVGISPARATLVVADQPERKPGGAFLAFDVSPGGERLVETGGGRLRLPGTKEPLLDVSQASEVGVLEVATAGGEHGIVWRSTGAPAPVPREPLVLGRGNVALLGADGVLLEVDTHDPRGAVLAEAADPQSLWSRTMGWWLGAIAVLLLMLAAARIAQVRRRRAAARGQAPAG